MDFKKVAQQNTLLSPLMVDRNKLETDEIIDQKLTIIEFGFAPKFDKSGKAIIDPDTGEADVFGVVIFAEKPEFYYCVGTVFTKVCKAWASGFDTTAEASAALAAEGGVKVLFHHSKTKSGNNLTSVDILN